MQIERLQFLLPHIYEPYCTHIAKTSDSPAYDLNLLRLVSTAFRNMIDTKEASLYDKIALPCKIAHREFLKDPSKDREAKLKSAQLAFIFRDNAKGAFTFKALFSGNIVKLDRIQRTQNTFEECVKLWNKNCYDFDLALGEDTEHGQFITGGYTQPNLHESVFFITSSKEYREYNPRRWKIISTKNVPKRHKLLRELFENEKVWECGSNYSWPRFKDWEDKYAPRPKFTDSERERYKLMLQNSVETAYDPCM